jgi:uncharacterized repeat protein (TIGR01451 family)
MLSIAALLVLGVALALVISDDVRAGGLADLRVTKTASVATAEVGDEITYTIVVTNVGATTATAVLLTDRLPPGLERVSVATDVGTCMEGRPIMCMLGDVAMGVTATITLVTRATADGRISNTASVVGMTADAETSDNASIAVTDVSLPSAPDAGPVDGGVPPDGAMMMEETDEGCGCFIPGGGRRGTLPSLGLLVACVAAHRLVRRSRVSGHRSYTRRWGKNG